MRGAGGNGGDQVNIIDKKGGSRKKLCHRRGIKHFCSTASKKNRMGTFDAATRTAFHFSRVDQGYLSCYFYLKTFKNKKKIFQNTDSKTNLDPFFQKKVESSIFI